MASILRDPLPVLRKFFRPRTGPAPRRAEPDMLMRLGRDEQAALLVGPAGRLEVLRGRAWLTIDGESADHFLGRGESLAVAPGCLLHASGDAPGATLLRFAASAPASDGRACVPERAAWWLGRHLAGRPS